MVGSGHAARSTVIVVTWRGRDHLAACLDALAAQSRPHATIVVDNGSTDGTADILAGRSEPTLRLRHNRGFAGGVAVALREVRTPFVAWLNDDAAPARDWLGALEDALDRESGAAAVGSPLVGPDGAVQSLGVRLTEQGYGADVTDDRVPVFGFCGGAVLLRTAAVRAAGGVPASFFCYYEDTDTAWRLRLAGWDVLRPTKVPVVHLHGASSGLGSWRFHRWNERNRLVMLLRCAPGRVARRELTRFAAITALLPFRRLRDRRAGKRTVPDAPNFSVRLRLLVLAEVLLRTPAALIARLRIGRQATISRQAIWRAWSGR